MRTISNTYAWNGPFFAFFGRSESGVVCEREVGRVISVGHIPNKAEN